MDKVVRNSRVVVYNRKDSPLATSRTWEREVVATSAASLAAAAASATTGGTGGIESDGGEPLDRPTEKIAISLQEWRTNTNALVATTAATTPAARKALLAYRADFAYSMLQLGNYRRGNPGLADELATIFDAAISLDRDIHLRSSAVEWQVLPPGQNKFDPDTMVVENDGVISSTVLVVLAPGLIKKGHDAVGDDVLCKMEVVCEVDRVANESQGMLYLWQFLAIQEAGHLARMSNY
ncbi:hypothetical protein MGG_17300 [Pyricularia oryzae 70-15]|uniref:Uncharacterized protein n=1 Tax=Pyricularia oryzae (strain 70-15 / ATCC MYA-4617 / FGSC 8958) TaxID=242507 RepID=G4NBL3_PYRO7|nr:uncharacterized protein MGG_17300 [Pyricularia oryzae 70-15]EHA48118.1 hypothetical protein MGG_17300 [Pyricularia oryzae 70-15]